MRGERATQGKTLADLEEELHLRAEILEGIENADLSAFPSPSFIAGYVRSYAAHRWRSLPDCRKIHIGPFDLRSGPEDFVKSGTKGRRPAYYIAFE